MNERAVFDKFARSEDRDAVNSRIEFHVLVIRSRGEDHEVDQLSKKGNVHERSPSRCHGKLVLVSGHMTTVLEGLPRACIS